MLSYKKINKIIKIKFLNLQSQVGGTTIDAKYFDDLIEYLNYTQRIFQYLDKFYMLEETEVTTIMSIKLLLKDLIYPLKKTLITYKEHLTNIHTIIKTSKNVFSDVPSVRVVKLVDLTTMVALKPLDNIQPTNQYDEDYLKIFEGVDYTKKFITSLLTQTDNLITFLEILSDIIINIEVLITRLEEEENIDKDRTNMQQRQREEYLSLEKKEKEERIKNQLAIKQEFTEWKKLKNTDKLESHQSSDYGTNPDN